MRAWLNKLVQWNVLVYAAMKKNEDLYIRTGKDLQAILSGQSKVLPQPAWHAFT